MRPNVEKLDKTIEKSSLEDSFELIDDKPGSKRQQKRSKDYDQFLGDSATFDKALGFDKTAHSALYRPKGSRLSPNKVERTSSVQFGLEDRGSSEKDL